MSNEWKWLWKWKQNKIKTKLDRYKGTAKEKVGPAPAFLRVHRVVTVCFVCKLESFEFASNFPHKVRSMWRTARLCDGIVIHQIMEFPVKTQRKQRYFILGRARFSTVRNSLAILTINAFNPHVWKQSLIIFRTILYRWAFRMVRPFIFAGKISEFIALALQSVSSFFSLPTSACSWSSLGAASCSTSSSTVDLMAHFSSVKRKASAVLMLIMRCWNGQWN